MEINAAWGQTVLLLYSLAKKMNLTFKRYALVPFGNHSHIECVEDQRELPLYGTGGFRFFWDTEFDQVSRICQLEDEWMKDRMSE